jgi:beta-galactosidase
MHDLSNRAFTYRAMRRWLWGSVAALVLLGQLRQPGATLAAGQVDLAKPGAAPVRFMPDARLRTRFSINEAWEFAASDASPDEAPAIKDSQWTTINLPHTWNAADAFDDAPGYRRGGGWYRKTLYLNQQLKGKRLFLYFEGANQETEVFVNGRSAGQHTGGYTAFVFDITELARFDDKENANLIAVKVDNRANPDVPPLNADFTFYGGIYRDVWLIATEPVHLTMTDHAAPGVYIDTPSVTAESATVRVRGMVMNHTNQARQLRIVSVIADAYGRKVATLTSALTGKAAEPASFEQVSEPLAAPHLWSPDAPYLYTVYTQVYEGNRAVDEVENPLGFRWFSIDADRGFYLNGKPLRLRGVNKHQDYPGLGNAVPNARHIRDLEIIKQMGANFVRLAHYPQDPVVLETADRLGLIIWEEIPVVNTITASEAFTANCKQMLTEMIRQHYNHPSVMMWGYMNEILLIPLKEPGYVEKVVALARALDALQRQEDPARLRVMAVHGSEIYNTAGLAEIPQALGWNLYQGWYNDSFPDFGKFVDDQHRRYPQHPLIISEYGGDADQRLHSLDPKRFDYTIEWQRRLHESYLEQMEARPFIAGSTVWVAFDFGSEFRGESKPHYNQKGLLTADRTPKDVYYFYKAKLAKEPVLRIATHDWTQRAGTNPAAAPGSGKQSVMQAVEVYTNLAEVELLINGRSLGRRSIDASRRVAWQVPLVDGANLIEARGQAGAQTVVDYAQVNFTYRAPQLADPSVPFHELAVNMGSNAQFTDATGLVWEADQAYVAGGWGYVEGAPEKTPANILGTLEDPLYQTMLRGLQAYRFDVPDGDYEVELRFVEPRYKDAGKRVFRVDLNDETALDNFDLAKQDGLGRAVARTFYVRVAQGQGIVLQFKALIEQPVVSAIRVRKLR